MEQKGQLQRISGERLEAVFLVEAPGPLVLGVDDNGTQTGDVGGLERAQQSIAQQMLAYSAPLELLRNGQAGQNHHGHRVLGQTFPRAFGGVGVFDRTVGEGVVAGYLAGVGDRHVGPGALALLALPSEPIEKTVEFAAAAIKRGDRVIRPQRPWLEELHRLDCFEEARLLEKLAKLGQLFGGRIQARAKLRPVPAGEPDAIVLQHDPFGVWEDPVHDELRDVHAG